MILGAELLARIAACTCCLAATPLHLYSMRRMWLIAILLARKARPMRSLGACHATPRRGSLTHGSPLRTLLYHPASE